MEAHNARELDRKKQKAYGRYDSGLVDVAPVREHMLALGEFGIGYKRVAMLAGVGITPARNIIWGRQDPGPRHGEMLKRVKRETAEKILAVQPVFENLAPGQKVPATGTHRRLQALVVGGWSQAKLATRMGLGNAELTTLLRRDQVMVSTHLAARDLFEELWNQEPPHESWPDKVAYSRSKNFAKARRWLPALAWDDIDTDVEPPVPDEIDSIDETAVVLAMQGEPVRLTPLERRECVLRLHRERWSDGRIAETIGCASKTVERIREELGLGAFEQSELRARGAA
ncbi:helix-turn-helix domain-containing protein [Microbacterium sp. 4-7]|uniref:helix-turn-helix domain-containing protein n=1 Tax=Microbacterium sp. 4-7 TaxID=1885327 RepID=UPI001650ACFE|nr:helix-turn-helix domain-containing protein [Microbacterium sp. 4-7]MBC6496081.1 hypothetical protein [Microbacterium sp. 4-7]